MNTNREYHSKKFLNEDGCHSDASVMCNFYFYRNEGTSHRGEIVIRDCSNYVSLSLGVQNEYTDEGGLNDDSFVNSMGKINILIEELTAFRERLIVARSSFKRRKMIEDEENKRCISGVSSGNGVLSGESLPASTEGNGRTETNAGTI